MGYATGAFGHRRAELDNPHWWLKVRNTLANLRRNVEADSARLRAEVQANFLALAGTAKEPDKFVSGVMDFVQDGLHAAYPPFEPSAAAERKESNDRLTELYKRVFYDPTTPEGQMRSREYRERYKAWEAEQAAARMRKGGPTPEQEAAAARLARASQVRL